ncbi:MAG TPA: methyl-accepting chemotaxis protein, partial [Anaeromyxobacteraceae bacterium]|nr:methyl-accepting chemotaxis protein [Anaeromyxobacteraceae bacterium]
MARKSREERSPSTRPSARWADAPHLVAMRGRAAETPPPRPPPATSELTVSLQSKILVSYLIVGGVLLFAVPPILQRTNVAAASAIILCLTLGLGWILTALIARTARITRLKVSAVEISRGDLSKTVDPLEPAWFKGHDEIDDLAEAIRTMQENLRDLVSRIQRTAQSVSESANELQNSAEDVNASTDEVATS